MKKGKFLYEPVIEKIGKYYYDNPKEHKIGEFAIVTGDENSYAFYNRFNYARITKERLEQRNAVFVRRGKPEGLFGQTGKRAKMLSASG